jgi:hypothetical protein
MMRSPQPFPTRQYAYASRDRALGAAATAQAAAFTLEAGAIYRFVMGRDALPRKLPLDELRRSLHDPLSSLVLGRGACPRTASALLDLVTAADGDAGGVPHQRVFLVADGGQIPWSPPTADVKRSFRFLLTRGRPNQEPALFINTTSPFDSDTAFLQVVGWDPVSHSYQFYDRRQGSWIWVGSSWDALSSDSRGQGPFDSHVNGALNMKELKAPWVHWHSMAAGIRDEVLAPDDTLRTHPLWQEREGAERLEVEIIRPAILRWNDARFAACEVNGHLTRLREFLRQVLDTSTINLAASSVESRELAPGKQVPLPLTFFIDSDALVDELSLEPGLTAPPSVDGGVYARCLKKYDVAITDGDHRFPGDTHFAFVVPERAFEDLLVLRTLLARGVISQKLAASMLMVDFMNPVFSRRRELLMRHVPETATVGAASDFQDRFISSLEQAAAGLPADAPQHELLENWRLSDSGWRPEFERRLAAFFAAVTARLAEAHGFEPLFELAESRRREFRKRPLAEFRLTTPVTSIPEDAPLLELLPDASVRAKA